MAASLLVLYDFSMYLVGYVILLSSISLSVIMPVQVEGLDKPILQRVKVHDGTALQRESGGWDGFLSYIYHLNSPE